MCPLILTMGISMLNAPTYAMFLGRSRTVLSFFDNISRLSSRGSSLGEGITDAPNKAHVPAVPSRQTGKKICFLLT